MVTIFRLVLTSVFVLQHVSRCVSSQAIDAGIV